MEYMNHMVYLLSVTSLDWDTNCIHKKNSLSVHVHVFLAIMGLW